MPIESISVEGNTTTIHKEQSTQTLRRGEYNSQNDISKTQFTQNNNRSQGFSKNEEYNNCQENYNLFGRTTGADIIVVGTPKMFEGNEQKIADNILSNINGLLLQPGDDRRQMSAAELQDVGIEAFAHMTAAQTSSMPSLKLNSFSTAIEDVGKYIGEIGTWLSDMELSNSAEAAKCYAEFKLERMEKQKEIFKQKMQKEYGESFTNITASSPATEDKLFPNKNITRGDVYEQYIPELNTLLAAQREIG